jgi:hypothetical protein
MKTVDEYDFDKKKDNTTPVLPRVATAVVITLGRTSTEPILPEIRPDSRQEKMATKRVKPTLAKP